MTKNVKKHLIIGVIALLVVLSIMFFFMSIGNPEKKALNRTYDLSKEYLSLRYRTDNILLEAKNYSDFKDWNTDLSKLISDWEDFENDTKKLEESGTKLSELKEINFNLIEGTYAYDKEEITRVFDNAPAGKKIATLAKHLGVDAKKAYAILKQDQAQVTADAWNEAGDTFSKLETSAIVIKDGCKVAGFVGGVILSGGTAGLATATTLTKATVIVTGADLILEVTDDAANISFGDNNGISAITRNIRTVTEPIANILSINKVDNKIDAVLLGIEKFRETAQEGQVLGIQLIPGKKFKVDTSLISKYKEPIYISELKSEEIDAWLEEQEIEYKKTTKEEVEELLVINEVKKDNNLNEKTEENNISINKSNIEGYWIEVEMDWNGNIMTNSSAYLEITDNQIFFISYYFDTESYAISDKHYKLNKDKISYGDYEESSAYVSFDGDNLILTEYNNGKNKEDGYKKYKYEKITFEDWPIKE